MFSNTHNHAPSVGSHNILRSFRSHRSLKHQIKHLQDGEAYEPSFLSAHAPVAHQRPVPNNPVMAHHPRRPSEASSIDTLNSDTSFPDQQHHHHHHHHHGSHHHGGRPSTSSSRREGGGSIDINPLRLHPPTEDDLFMSSPTTSLRSPPRHHYERKHLGSSGSSSSSSTSSTDSSSVDMGRSPPPVLGFRDRSREQGGHHLLQRQRGGGSLEIHDGFDFGFDSTSSVRTPVRNTMPAATGGSGRAGRGGGGEDYFGIPAQVNKSRWSLTPTPTPGTGLEEEEEEEEDEDVDETPGPRTEWATPTKQRLPLGNGGTDSPEYFIKRGDWKRRGIVFGGSGSKMAGEEEAFDLDG
ncbi:hypothetical protein GE09DRAFT_71660 [Coniochaeta sp. 2T2.1]|nr:hypothetical protein GE09DRAFT_71660 [Coniochaeta sp. 2T2.1]